MFYLATLDTEGHGGYLGKWYPMLNCIINEIGVFKDEFAEAAETDTSFTVLMNNLEHAFEKAQKYFRLSDDMPVLYAAVMLDPTQKHEWFRANLWPQSNETDGEGKPTPIAKEQRKYLQQVKDLAKELWIKDYQGSATSPIHAPNPTAKRKERTFEDIMYERMAKFSRLSKNSSSSGTSAANTDVFDEYLDTDTVPFTSSPEQREFDVHQYWIDRRRLQPELSKFALDILALPLMSDDCERSFSSGRDLITYRRGNLLSDVIEACEVLRNWYGKPVLVEEKDKDGKTVKVNPFDDEEAIEQDWKENNPVQPVEDATAERSDSEVIQDI